MNTPHAVLISLVFFISGAQGLFGQINDGGLSVSVNDENFFVIQGDEATVGIVLESRSGSLIPGPIAPFQITLGTTSEFHVTAANLGSEVQIDGELVLQHRWNPLGEGDVTYTYGRSATPFGPFPAFDEPPPVLDVVRVSFDDGHQFVLNGTGQRIDEFVLFSDAGGLIPSTTGAPFSSLTLGDPSNDADSIKFTSDSFVTIDGAVAIDAGWDRNLGFRDVRYSYREHDSGEEFGPYRLPGSAYPRVPPSSNIGVRIDGDDHSFVLSGKGHELKSFELSSPSGSLVPASSAAPFESFRENTPSQVEYTTSARVLLDGTLKLDVRYDANVAGEDVTYRYSQTGFPKPRGPLDVQGPYPPNPQRSPLLVQLGDDKAFQLGGKGQRLTSFTLLSEGGSLVALDDPSPFEFSAVSETEVTLILPASVPVFDLDLPVHWNESVADLRYSYTLEGIEETFGPRRIEIYPAENTLGVVQASFQSQSVTVLDGRGQEIVGFEVLSPSGSLRNNGDVRPFDRLEIESPQHLSFVSDEPIPVGIFFSLPFEWRGEGDLEFIWHTADSRALVTSVNYVNFGLPEPSSAGLAAFLVIVPLWCRRPRI